MGRFRTIIDANYEQRPTTTRRWEKTLELLPNLDHVGRVLDLGDRTRLTELLEKKWKCQITNSNGDLDIIKLSGEYDVVTSFEVIEHLFNPLYNLLQVRKVLKPGGRLFLTTPLGKPYFLWSPQHFHEMHWERLASLLGRADYQIQQKNVFRLHPWWFYFTGLRPFLRLFFDRRVFLELTPA